MDAKKPYVKLGQVFHFGFLSLTCASFRVLRVAATVSRTVAPTKQRIVHGSSCKSVRLATRSADLSGCETAQIFNSWDSWDNTGIREPPNCSPEPTSGFFLTPMLARIWRRGGDSNPRWRFWPPKRFSKRVIALWLAGKLLKTQHAVWLALDGLGTVGSLLG